ncbi:MAG: glycosyltransferase [Chitinophagaceae bacterium]
MPTAQKIILIGTAFPFRGGLASFNERLIKEYIMQGYQAEIYNFSLQYPSFLFPGKTQLSSSAKPIDIPITQCINSINPINWVKVGLKLQREKPDLIITKYWLPFMAPCLGTIVRIAKIKSKVKVITIIDNIIPHEKKIGDTLLTTYFVKPIDAFVTMSQKVSTELKMFNKKQKPFSLNPHPLFDNFGDPVSKNEACQFLNIDANKQYILFFGIIRDYKGLDLLIRAFAKICEQIPNVNLLIVGEAYANEAKYKQLIEQFQIQQRIHYHNQFVSNEDVKYWFSAAQILALPYKEATQSGVTQIGFHFELPMLVTQVGGLPELIHHQVDGLIVQPKEEDIAQALLQFFNDDKYIKMKQAMKQSKLRFSWSHMVHTIQDLYEKVK